MTDTTAPQGDALDALLGTIESEMHARRLSPAAVARRAGVPVSTVRQLRGQRPTMAAALGLAWALDITPSRIRPTSPGDGPRTDDARHATGSPTGATGRRVEEGRTSVHVLWSTGRPGGRQARRRTDVREAEQMC